MSAAAPPKPLVSVIIPTHARRALLERLLDSLLAQDWPHESAEIIVVHNHTPDGTEEMVRARIPVSQVALHYHRTEFNRPGPSRQFGAERAQGAVLAFIDDDCIATPGWIAAGVRALAAGHALVQGRTIPHPAQPRRLLEKTMQVEGPSIFFETCNIFYDAAAFRAVGGFPVEFRALKSSEDTSLGWAIRAAGRSTGYTAEALVHHEVFAVGLGAWLRAVEIVEVIPLVAQRYPAMRAALFWRYFLSAQTAAFNAFAVGAIGGSLLHPSIFAACLPYVWLRFTDRGRFTRPHFLLARFVCGMPRAALMAAWLVRGSWRARSVVL